MPCFMKNAYLKHDWTVDNDVFTMGFKRDKAYLLMLRKD